MSPFTVPSHPWAHWILTLWLSLTLCPTLAPSGAMFHPPVSLQRPLEAKDLFIVAMAALPFCMLWQHRCTHTEFTDKMALVCSPTNAIYRMGVIAELLILLSCTICITTYFAIATQCSFPTKPITSIHYREPSHCLTFINLPKSLQNKIFFLLFEIVMSLKPLCIDLIVMFGALNDHN